MNNLSKFLIALFCFVSIALIFEGMDFTYYFTVSMLALIIGFCVICIELVEKYKMKEKNRGDDHDD